MHKQSGFTLVELLVVIAVIAVLAALLFPVFTTARQASTASVCASNLRQLSKATLLYTPGLRRVFPVGVLSDGECEWDVPTHGVGGVAALPARLSRRAVPCRPAAD
jgi:prepilin-type N-terminal cleavage/methylation domain-containing protein